MADDGKGQVSLWGAVAIGVGGMVGGGIFAVLGLAAQLAGGATPIAFAIGGVVALLTSYSYAKLSVSYPSQGGTIVFLDRAFGCNILTGGINIMLWLNYVVMLALYSYAFGSYGSTFFAAEHHEIIKHLLLTAGILFPTALNLLGSGIISKAETLVVGVKMAILLVVMVAGFGSLEPARLAVSTWSPLLTVVAGGMIIFVAYEGFELIANTAEDVVNPQRNLPRAYYISVGSVTVLYVLIAVVTMGALPMSAIVSSSDYVLAQAASPSMGQIGFNLVVVAALLATFSAINATLYGAARLSYSIAKEGELPGFLEKKIWNQPLEGLLITSVLAVVLANLADLSSISTMGSAGFLLVFAAVNAANFKLAATTLGKRWISAAGTLVCLGALGTLLAHTADEAPQRLWFLAALIGGSLALEALYRLAGKGRPWRLHHGKPRGK